MQFMILAYDKKGDDTQIKRASVKPSHLKVVDNFKKEGAFRFGGNILGDNEGIIGSVVVLESESESVVRNYLNAEPYVTNQVWENIEVLKVRLVFD